MPTRPGPEPRAPPRPRRSGVAKARVPPWSGRRSTPSVSECPSFYDAALSPREGSSPSGPSHLHRQVAERDNGGRPEDVVHCAVALRVAVRIACQRHARADVDGGKNGALQAQTRAHAELDLGVPPRMAGQNVEADTRRLDLAAGRPRATVKA